MKTMAFNSSCLAAFSWSAIDDGRPYRRRCEDVWIVGTVLLSAGVCQSQEANKPADVIVYVKAASVPSPVDYGARSQVTWMFKQIGVRIVWRDGVPGPAIRPEETWVIKVDFNSRVPPDEHSGALAYAMPFSQGAIAITIMYDRLQFAVAARPRLEQAVLRTCWPTNSGTPCSARISTP